MDSKKKKKKKKKKRTFVYIPLPSNCSASDRVTRTAVNKNKINKLEAVHYIASLQDWRFAVIIVVLRQQVR